MARPRTSTTRLPAALREELDGNADATHQHRKRGKHTVSRKDARKQERDEKKQRKMQFFSAGGKRRVEDEVHEEAPKSKKARTDPPTQSLPNFSSQSGSKPTAHPSKQAGPSKQAKLDPTPKEKSRLKDVAEKPKPKAEPIVAPRSQRERDEDRYITMLESKLGYKKKGKNKAEEDDGLDDLLEFADTIGIPDVEIDGPEEMDTDEEDEEEGDDAEEEDGEDEEEDLEHFYDDEEDDSEEEHSDAEEWGGIGESAEVKGANDVAEEPKTTAYVPPHMRNRGGPPSDSEDLVKLKRNLKGLLNRMSEQNMVGILESVEDLYRRNSRNDVTSSLTSLIIEGIASHDLLLDSYVVLHAAFISALYKIMGVDFAASFVQSIVESYETHYAALGQSDDDKKGKECSNLLILLAELYNFQVISCVLVYDLIRTLLADETLSETNVELLLKLIRSAGQQLRTDDPAALKDITQIVQDKVSASAEKPSSRTAFMIETLTNLKNGKVKKIGAQNQGGEAVESMKKFPGALAKKRHVLGHEALSVSLEDLHSADTKGKWWLVGAPWKGDPLVDRQQAMAGKSKDMDKEVSPTSGLLKLAKKQGMNTDIRRSIFVVLMSSDDYIDACERLAQLNLTEIQQREVIRVLLHCCGNEKTYNPYYTLVAAHLCSITHAPKITLQFCLWDFLRDLGQSEAGGAEIIKSMQESGGSFDLKDISDTRMRNVAKAYAWWIAKDCVSLAVLKPIDFTVLKTKTKVFLSELLDQIFVGTQVTTPLVRSTKELMLNKNRTAIEQVFLRATRVETLSMGLVYFLTRMYETEDAFMEWAADIAKDTLKTGVDVIPDL